MTDDTREQIKKDAREWWEDEQGPDYDPDGAHEDSFIDGATHQHPIAFASGRRAGRIEVFDEILSAMSGAMLASFGAVHDMITELKKLEALKTKV